MAKYRCSVCGYIYDEQQEGAPFSGLKECPVCHQSADKFTLWQEETDIKKQPARELKLDYPKEFVRCDASCRYMKEIHEMAVTGKSISAAMGTLLPVPDWDDILILGAQLDPMPLDEDAEVRTTTVIGPHAAKPLVLENPVYISHMSFGALSREAKVSLARGSAMAHSAMCSGEGGILPEEMEAADKYIFEYVGNLYSVTPENLRNADAIEIKIGQGTKPGMGGHLPGEKVTEEISRIRNKPMGRDVIAPSRFPGIETKEDMKALVASFAWHPKDVPSASKLPPGILNGIWPSAHTRNRTSSPSTAAEGRRVPLLSFCVTPPAFPQFTRCTAPENTWTASGLISVWSSPADSGFPPILQRPSRWARTPLPLQVHR